MPTSPIPRARGDRSEPRRILPPGFSRLRKLRSRAHRPKLRPHDRLRTTAQHARWAPNPCGSIPRRSAMDIGSVIGSQALVAPYPARSPYREVEAFPPPNDEKSDLGTCKPDSVRTPRGMRRIHFSRAPCGARPRLRPPAEASRAQRVRPTRDVIGGPPRPLFGLAPGWVSRATGVAARRGGLLPHLFTITCRPDGLAPALGRKATCFL